MTTVNVHPAVSREPLPLDAEDLPNVCVLCSHNCGVRLDVRNGDIVAVRADERSPITHGYICNKAFSVPVYVRHAQRVTHPLRRCADGGFERISWETAIAEIAARLASIRAAHSPRAIGLVGIGGQANHLDGPYGIGFLRGLGSRMWFNALAQEKTQHWLVDQWMFHSSPAVTLHPDQAHTQFMLVMGTNPRISNRGHNANDSFPALAADPSRTMVVVDPRETETTRTASRHLRIRPGTDAYLLLALLKTIVAGEGLADERFLRDRVEGFAELRAVLDAVDVGEMAALCDLDADAIVATAVGFANAQSASVFYDLGVEQTPYSTLISYLIRALLVVTGNIGQRGGNVFFENLSPPALDMMRVRDSERTLVAGIPAIRALGNMAMFSPTLVPEEILVDHPQRLRALIVEGSNPLLSYSDAARWREAREKLDLLVVIDPAMTETAELADYVLPAPVGYEKWEIASFPKGYPEILAQLRPPAVPGPAEALPEPEIYARLAEAMDLFGAAPPELHERAERALTAEGAAEFLSTAQLLAAQSGKGVDPNVQVLFWAYRTLGPLLPAPSLVFIWLMCALNAMLRTESVLRTLGAEWEGRGPFEIAAELFRRLLAHPEGVEIARLDPETNLEDHINFADKRVRLLPEPMRAEIARAVARPPVLDAEFPFVLAAGLRTRWTANTIQRDPSWRKGRGPHCALNLSANDARRLGVRSGDVVRLTTRRGSVTLPAQIDTKLRDGHVWMPNGFGHAYLADGRKQVVGVNQNELTDVADRDPFTGIPHHRFVPCRVEAVEGA